MPNKTITMMTSRSDADKAMANLSSLYEDYNYCLVEKDNNSYTFQYFYINEADKSVCNQHVVGFYKSIDKNGIPFYKFYVFQYDFDCDTYDKADESVYITECYEEIYSQEKECVEPNKIVMYDPYEMYKFVKENISCDFQDDNDNDNDNDYNGIYMEIEDMGDGEGEEGEGEGENGDDGYACYNDEEEWEDECEDEYEDKLNEINRIFDEIFECDGGSDNNNNNDDDVFQMTEKFYAPFFHPNVIDACSISSWTSSSSIHSSTSTPTSTPTSTFSPPSSQVKQSWVFSGHT